MHKYSKIGQNQKSETLLVPNISVKGDSTCNNIYRSISRRQEMWTNRYERQFSEEETQSDRPMKIHPTLLVTRRFVSKLQMIYYFLPKRHSVSKAMKNRTCCWERKLVHTYWGRYATPSKSQTGTCLHYPQILTAYPRGTFPHVYKETFTKLVFRAARLLAVKLETTYVSINRELSNKTPSHD